MPASVFIEHGTMAIAEQLWLPLAIVAPRSRLLCTVSAPAFTLSPYFEDRYGTSFSSVASSPSSSRSNRRPKSDTTSSTWTPRAINSASVLTAYSAPLAPVMATAILAADINGHGENRQIENPDVAVEIERAFDLGQIVSPHERVLVEQHRHDETDDPDVVERRKRRHIRHGQQHSDGHDVHRARNEQRRRDAEAHGNRAEAVRAIELEILARVEDVETADPRADRDRENPRLPSPAPAHRQPSANRRDRHREAEKQLRVRRIPFGERIPEDDCERERREQQAQSAQLPRREKKHDGRRRYERRRFSERHRAARQFAIGCSRIERVHARIDEPVEPHRGAARRHHRDENPRKGPQRERRMTRCQQRSRQRKRQGE